MFWVERRVVNDISFRRSRITTELLCAFLSSGQIPRTWIEDRPFGLEWFESF